MDYLPIVTDEKLVERAVRGARSPDKRTSPRWVAVMDTLAVGSTVAQSLCRRFGFDPDEHVRGHG